MANTGILVVTESKVTPPAGGGTSATSLAWTFTVPQGSDLLTAASSFTQTLNLPIGVTAQVFDAASSATYKLSGTWTAA